MYMLRAWNWMIRGKYGVKIAENVVWKRSDESWKKAVGFPGCNHLSAIADCEAESIAGNQRLATRSPEPPNVHLHATDPPTVRPLWLFIYCRLPKCTGAWWRADALMDANYFESPAPSPCHPVMGNVIGLFANRAKRGIVLVETFSISQKGLNPPLKALSCSGYICCSCRAGIVQKAPTT